MRMTVLDLLQRLVKKVKSLMVSQCADERSWRITTFCSVCFHWSHVQSSAKLIFVL